MSAEKTSSKINEILKGLATKYQKKSQNQSLEGLSNLRKTSLKLFQKLDALSDKYVKHQALKSLIMTFVRPHIQNVILNQIPEKELAGVLKECFEELRPEFEEITLAKELKLTPTDKKLNDKILKLPKFQQYKEIGDVLF